ncbi:MAG TPA: hypothetical protein VJS65_02350, partial [Verrucomicrobiae bacterium]|nr:hypothetical protein [Verrucomicrobiae bacterium]
EMHDAGHVGIREFHPALRLELVSHSPVLRFAPKAVKMRMAMCPGQDSAISARTGVAVPNYGNAIETPRGQLSSSLEFDPGLEESWRSTFVNRQPTTQSQQDAKPSLSA